MDEINMLIEGINMISELEIRYFKLKIYLFKWGKPLQVIAYMNTEEVVLILNHERV